MKGAGYFLLSALALLLSVVFISSCDKEKTSLPTPEECTETISFLGIVEPLIQQNCSVSGCHDAFTSSSGYNLEGHENISTNGKAILSVIKHNPGMVAMPLGQPKLNDSIIEKFSCWLAQGKSNN